jgi:tRNA modification GTPase
MPHESAHVPFTNDTIVAISTPPGRGGIGIVRLSGSLAKSIAEPILKLRQPLAHTIARFAVIVDNTHVGEKLDEAVVTYFAAPNSYTAEDVVEIAAHGSPVVLEYLVRHALASGARLARPGEFTERAFLSGRIDLTQAEAVRDLIEAQTIVQARLAAEQMGGALSRRIAPVKELLFSLIATLEAGIDFAEDDIDVMPSPLIIENIKTIQIALAPIAASYAAGRILHDGLTLAIVGKPNAGKSSLFNRLVERERAIVTPVAGTTRDLVIEKISIAGIPVELVDTAGLRTTSDLAEAIGIEKTREAMADADLVLAIVDATDIVTIDDASIADNEAWQQTLSDTRTILVVNKVDLLQPAQALALENGLRSMLPSHSTEPTASQQQRISSVSALTGAGIEDLRTKVLAFITAGGQNSSTGMLTSVRHYEAIQQSEAALTRALEAISNRIPHEMLLMDLHAALQSLDTLTGTTTADDILNRIFSTFCIGK